MPSPQEKLEVLKAFALADALGMPFEEFGAEGIPKTPLDLLRRAVKGGGALDQVFGVISDDTSMFLLTMDAFLVSGGSRPAFLERLVKNLCDFFENGAFTSEGRLFDIGVTTQIAVQRLLKGVPPSHSGEDGFEACGNGPLPRALALGVLLAGEKGKDRLLGRLAAEATFVTHSHPISVATSVWLAFFVKSLMEKKSERAASIEAFAKSSFHFLVEGFDIRRIYGLRHLLSTPKKGSAFSPHTVQNARAAAEKGQNAFEAAAFAIMDGGDTDSIGALAAGLFAARHGIGDEETRMLLPAIKWPKDCQILFDSLKK